ncbi:MAG: metallophosphoesterase family protein [Chloroflexota bacterium]
MRIALFSDIHGNLSGLRAVLAKIDQLGGADRLVAAGDLIGGGPGADDLFDLLLERRVALLRGNTEEMMLDASLIHAHAASPYLDLMLRTHDWLHAHLSPAYWKLIEELPLSLSIEAAPGQRIFACHAAPQDTWAYTTSAEEPVEKLRAAYGQLPAQVVAYGHFHQHHVLRLDDKLLLNVASVGLRSDGLSALTLVEYRAAWVIRQFQVPYDVAEERRLMAERRVPG